MGIPGGRLTVRATAPVRISDLGGWTDTWFAGHGRVCNIAAEPGVEVEVAVAPLVGSAPPVQVDLVSFADRYAYDPAAGPPGRHPLLEGVVEEIGLPPGCALTIRVRSAVPPGSATGTSGSVVVALVGALLGAAGRPVDPTDVARTGHRIETGRLGRQSGVQDHLAAAHGGICDIRIDGYPDATVARVEVGDPTWQALGERLGVVSLGQAHDSSAVHDEVIASLEAADRGAVDARLDPLRRAAADGADALRRGDLVAYADAMAANTRAQAALHPGLIGADARRVAEVATANGAAAVKVNGAGGDGGSLTVLAGTTPLADVLAAVAADDPRYTAIPVGPTRHGLRVEVTPST